MEERDFRKAETILAPEKENSAAGSLCSNARSPQLAALNYRRRDFRLRRERFSIKTRSQSAKCNADGINKKEYE